MGCLQFFIRANCPFVGFRVRVVVSVVGQGVLPDKRASFFFVEITLYLVPHLYEWVCSSIGPSVTSGFGSKELCELHR